MAPFDARFSRRDLLQAGLAAGALASPGAASSRSGVSCIFLMLVGGPSHLDTWDPKPDAPSEVRGPFKPIATNVGGIQVSELFPRMARHAGKYALVRSVRHDRGAMHDTGHQLVQTGRVFKDGIEHPHVGCIVARETGSRHVILPSPIRATGGGLPHGQGAGYLGPAHEPLLVSADPSRDDFLIELRRDRREALACGASAMPATETFDLGAESQALRDRYGRTKFGQSCLVARRLVERGTRFITVNMHETVFNETTWDVHGSRPFTTLQSFGETVAPAFDYAYSALLQDLHDRGMLENTLVIATGEFGRTPRLNPAGGRDHWPQCWTMLFAGGGVQGGQVIGGSDGIGAYPKERPVTPAEVAATVYHAVGIDPGLHLAGPGGKPIPAVEAGARPIVELF